MATYVWDLGFDFTDFQDPNNNNQSPLEMGFVTFAAPPGGAPGNSRNLQVNDIIQFNGFDLTPNASVGDGTTIQGGTITFIDAHSGQPASPFGGSATISFLPNLGQSTALGPSAILGPTLSVQYPRWWPVINPQTVTNEGHFLMTVSISAQQGGQTGIRTFVHDPEMVVGSVGG